MHSTGRVEGKNWVKLSFTWLYMTLERVKSAPKIEYSISFFPNLSDPILDSTWVLLRRVTIGRSRPCLVNSKVFRPILSCQTPKCTLTVTIDGIKHSFLCLPIFVMTARATNELLQSFPSKKCGLAARHESLQSAGLEYRLELMPRFSDVCLKLLTMGRGHTNNLSVCRLSKFLFLLVQQKINTIPKSKLISTVSISN